MGNSQGSSAQVIPRNSAKILLDIPARFQWQNENGYCGQTAIQMCGLYYGNYLSQIKVRQAAGSQALIGENAQKALQDLGFVIQPWNSDSPQPQYQNYLQWIKKHIMNGHPVIIAGYQPSGKNEAYDHIYIAVGVSCNNYEQYDDNDVLIYDDLNTGKYFETPFGKIWDTRSMQDNGKNLEFALPKDVNYGIAVKGIADKGSIFLPVRINLEKNREPNVSLGQNSVQFQLKVRVSQLTAGTKYAVLRYSNHTNLPEDLLNADVEEVIKFEADGPVYDFVNVCDSSSQAFYRCVEEKRLE